MITLLIVEDHPAIADALGALLAGDEIAIEGVVHDAAAAALALDRTPPDVVLCDVMLGGNDRGFELLERYGTAAAFVMYSAFDFPAHHARAIELGALAFVSKMADAQEIQGAVRRAAEGKATFPPHILASARGAARRPTARELEVIRHVARGETNDALAARFGLRVKSIEGALRRLFDRYSVDNRTQLVALAMREGWITAIPGGQRAQD